MTLVLGDESCWLSRLPLVPGEPDANAVIYRKGWYLPGGGAQPRVLQGVGGARCGAMRSAGSTARRGACTMQASVQALLPAVVQRCAGVGAMLGASIAASSAASQCK